MSEKRESKPLVFALLVVLSALLATVATLYVYADEAESGGESSDEGGSSGSNDEGTESSDDNKDDTKKKDDDNKKIDEEEEKENNDKPTQDTCMGGSPGIDGCPGETGTKSEPELGPLPVKLLPNESSNPIVADDGLKGIALTESLKYSIHNDTTTVKANQTGSAPGDYIIVQSHGERDRIIQCDSPLGLLLCIDTEDKYGDK